MIRHLALITLVVFGKLSTAQIFIDPEESYNVEQHVKAYKYMDLDEIEWSGPEAFSSYQIPIQWEDESAVIIARKQQIVLNKDKETLAANEDDYFMNVDRVMILLNDQSAITNLSEINYWEFQVVRVRIIKASGQVINVPVDGVLIEQEEVSFDQFKFSIPGLEVGDIIDLFKITKTRVRYDFWYGNQSIDMTNWYYPTLYQEFEWLVHKEWFMNVHCSEAITPASFEWLDGKGEVVDEKKGKYKHVKVIVSDAVRVKNERFSYPEANSPMINYWILRKIDHDEDGFLMDDVSETADGLDIHAEIIEHSSEELAECRSSYASTVIEEIQAMMPDILNKSGSTRSESETRELVEAMYKSFRYVYYAGLLYKKSVNKTDGSEHMPGMTSKFGNNVNIGSGLGVEEISCFSHVLNEFDIEHEIFVTTDRVRYDLSSIPDLKVLEYGIRIPVSATDSYYITHLSPYTDLIANQNPYVEGQDALVILSNSGQQVGSVLTVPHSSAESNLKQVSMEVSFSEDYSEVQIESTTTLTGIQKFLASGTRLSFGDWFVEEVHAMDPDCGILNSSMSSNSRPGSGGGDEVSLEEVTSDVESAVSDNYSARLEEYKAELEKHFIVTDMNSYSIVNPGRELESSLVYAERYELGELTSTLGSNIIFNVGSLIGGQIAIEETELNRINDIEFDYAKSYAYEIRVKVPDGYSAQGLESLTFSVDNDAGTFISSAEMDGQTLIVRTEKTYKDCTMPKEAWEPMVEFLDAAYNFSQQSVVIKPN